MFSQIQTHLISITILLVIYVSIKHQTQAVKQKNRYFLMLVILNIAVMTFKILTTLTKGYTTGIEHLIVHGSVAIYYLITVLIVFYFLLYLHYHVKGEAATKKYLYIAYAPFFLMAVIAIMLSFIGLPVMYEISPSGEIVRHFMYGPVIFTEFFIMLGSASIVFAALLVSEASFFIKSFNDFQNCIQSGGKFHCSRASAEVFHIMLNDDF